MFVLYVVLADLWAHVGRYDLRPQAMCIRPARAMWVLWFERVWSWELPTRKKNIFLKKKYPWPKRFWDVFSLCSAGWSLRTWRKIWSKTASYVYETCKGHVSALVWKGLKLGTSNKKKYLKKKNLTQEVFRLFSLCSAGWSFRTCGKIRSKTPSYVYETCKGHESALVWKGLKLGTSNTQKRIFKKNNNNIIFLTQEVLRCFFSM